MLFFITFNKSDKIKTNNYDNDYNIFFIYLDELFEKFKKYGS